MATKERTQNLKIDDTALLRFFVWNDTLADPDEITQVDIYKLFEEDPTEENPFGRRLVETIDAADIVKDETGKYHISVDLEGPLYTQGRYQDEWNIIFEDNTPVALSPMDFAIGPDAWFTDSRPLVHDFSFDFRPNRLTHGSKRYIEITVTPNVARGSDKQRYYENLVAAGTLYVSMEQKCGECLPAEQDLRLVFEDELVAERDGCTSYFLIDAREDGELELECGMYDVWFTLTLGENVYVSDRQPLQIFH